MDDYERMMREFCSLNDIVDVEAVKVGSPLDVGGVTCSITPSRHDPAHAFVVYCVFGAAPAGRESECFQELMVQNHIGSPDGGAVFGFSSVAKEVICMQHLKAGDMTAERLMDLLHHLAEKALEWRRTFFLQPQDARTALQAIPSAAATHALLGKAARR